MSEDGRSSISHSSQKMSAHSLTESILMNQVISLGEANKKVFTFNLKKIQDIQAFINKVNVDLISQD